METPLVLTIISPDRPGLVDALSGAIAKNSGNWLESRMCKLGGQFAGILRIGVAEENKEALLSDLGKLESKGLKITVESTQAIVVEEGEETIEMEILGQDRPGIVSQISAAFAKHNVNVEELSTGCRSAPMSGEQLFEATARIRIPSSCELSELRGDLEKVAEDLMVDVSFLD
ncbi:ACT domain-containing protein [Puniceicoccaceae bacterium K14]|nr:ACT domain-containing protein [Puniceicoccaceae bacterium K14]